MGFGEKFRAAREEKGLSYNDITRRTYIQPKFLRAIEESDLGGLPTSHYKFFVRDYARALGLDPDDILAELPPYPAPVLVQASLASDKPSITEEAKPLYIKEKFSRKPRYTPLDMGGSPIATWLIAGAIVLMLAIGIYYVVGGFDDEGGSAAADGSGEAIDTSGGMQTQIISGQENDTTIPQIAPVETGDSLTLEGHALGRVWFSIVMDGKRSETATIDSGTVKTWRASSQFKISMGNAGGLELTLNGKPLGALGPKQTVVRNQVIDAGGVKQQTVRRPTTTNRTNAGQSTPPPRRVTSTPLREPDNSNSE